MTAKDEVTTTFKLLVKYLVVLVQSEKKNLWAVLLGKTRVNKYKQLRTEKIKTKVTTQRVFSIGRPNAVEISTAQYSNVFQRFFDVEIAV